MKALKKIIPICMLALALVITVILIAPKPQAATCGELTYKLSNDQVTITDCNISVSGDFVIPDTIDGYPVRSIGSYAFYECYRLQSVTIPDSVTSIGNSAFWGCSSLQSITIPDGVTYIGDFAFRSCSSLTSVTIPDSVTSIGNSAFDFCDSLTGVYITDVEAWCNIDFKDCFSNPLYYAHKLYLSGELVTDLAIPDSVTTIGGNAFRSCSSLTSITIPDSITSIGDGAFCGCSSLTDITIPDSVTTIGYESFENCTSLQSITIPDGVTSIGSSAFYKCSSLNYNVYDNAKYLGNTKNPYVVLLEVTSTDITECKIAEKTKLIYSSAFRNCTGLQSVTIPDSVVSIGSLAFENCTSLQSITIPDSVTSIGSGTFSGCTSLESITLPFVGDSRKTASDTYQYPLGYIFGKSSYTGGTATEQYYYGSSTTSRTSSSYYIPNSLKSVTVTGGDILFGAFYNCTRLTSVTIPDGVTSIVNSAFYKCSSLTSITIPDSVTTIGDYAFYKCSSLQSVTIPDSVTTIGDYAFYNCYSLQSVTIPDSVTTIGDGTFDLCYNLQSVYYAGTQSQWEKIDIGSNNSKLTNATIYYNHIHDYTLIPPVTVAPTCTEAGYLEYTCLYGDTYRESIPALGHSEREDTDIIPPTCTEQGCTKSTCTRCGEATKTDYVDALGHNYAGEKKTVEPTCTERGYTETKCTRCDATAKTDYMDSLGHNVVVVQLRDATCTQQGVTKIGTMCDRCQEVFVAPTYTPALGHDFVNGTCSRCRANEDGSVYGDLTGDTSVNNDDVVLLLWHTLFPEDYPLGVSGDINKDGSVNNDDVVLLLWHTLFPEDYPI